jgi:hypothetical protein
MKRLPVVFALILCLAVPLLAQYRGQRLSPDDQRRFDSYYQRWQEYRRTNNREQIASMEKRMQDVMSHYRIPSNTPYGVIASGGGSSANPWAPYHRYRGKFSAGDQSRYDSYHSRWLEYRRTNNREQIVSMEKRMQDVMRHYDIPTNTPYDVLASDYQGNGPQGWQGRRDRDNDRYDRDRDDRQRHHDRDDDRDRDPDDH